MADEDGMLEHPKPADGGVRTRILRVLAGLLALVFGWFLLFADRAGLTPHKLVTFWIITIAFAVFAGKGTEPADRLLRALFGIR